MKFTPKFALMVMFIFVGTSCLKSPSQTEDHGPAVASLDVQKAIANAWGSVDPATIKKNEFMYLEQDQKISTLDPRVVYKESTQVLDRVETSDTYEYSLLLRSTVLDESGSFKPVTSTEQNISVKKSDLMEEVQTQSDRPAFPASLEDLQRSMANGTVGLREKDDGKVHERFLGLQTVLSMYDACVKTANWDVTCHNLIESQGTMAPPTGISSKPNCGGIPNCQISYRKIAFDLVVNLPDATSGENKKERVIYEMTISPDLPYLSRLTEFCYQGLVQASGQRILVKICNRVQNYEIGTDN